MNDSRETQNGERSSSRFHIVQPLRDLESNWAVDLSKNLEEYLLKICSGEIIDDDGDHFSVNFTEAALLLQGSIQVYSRKVEYLYTLVLNALEFISQKRQQDQPDKTSDQPEGSDSHTDADEENEQFLSLDDVPVEAKNCLSDGLCKVDILNHFVKPPANIVVLEGDCLDTAGDAGELESYLLASNNLYRDFLLLDPCDAAAINGFLKRDNAARRGCSLRPKTRKSLKSPIRWSGGTVHRSQLGRDQDINLNQTSGISCNFDVNNTWPDHPDGNVPENDDYGDEMGGGCSELGDDSDNDPWKPLNPHEPGNLKVKPFKKVKVLGRQGISSTKQISLTTQFPLARMCGTISPDLTETWEAQVHACERLREPQFLPLYEKLRQSLVLGQQETCTASSNSEDENEDNEYENDILDVDMPQETYMDVEDDPYSHASLEDLCRSHLDALLASIAETEKQTELATRVSTWKQRIEHTLEEQEAHPPFDIHEYGERVLNILTLAADSGGDMSFADVVRDQEKHDVARTFSALLQLVNNRNVDLSRCESGGESVCYTAVNPFCIRLLSQEKRQEEWEQLRSSKKRMKSPLRKGCTKVARIKSVVEKMSTVGSSSLEFTTTTMKSSLLNSKFSVKLGNVGGIRCMPEGKRRRMSRLIEPVDLQSAG